MGGRRIWHPDRWNEGLRSGAPNHTAIAPVSTDCDSASTPPLSDQRTHCQCLVGQQHHWKRGSASRPSFRVWNPEYKPGYHTPPSMSCASPRRGGVTMNDAWVHVKQTHFQILSIIMQYIWLFFQTPHVWWMIIWHFLLIFWMYSQPSKEILHYLAVQPPTAAWLSPQVGIV